MDALAALGGFDTTQRAEWKFRWCRIVLAAKDEKRYPLAIGMAQNCGRMKYCRPLFRDLASDPARYERAVEAFREVEDTYHPITKKMLCKDLKIDPA